MNKRKILTAIENGELQVNWDNYVLDTTFADGDVVIHGVTKNGEALDEMIDVVYREHDDIIQLRDAIDEEVNHGDGPTGDNYWILMDQLVNRLECEHNDRFDYESEPLVYIGGELQ